MKKKVNPGKSITPTPQNISCSDVTNMRYLPTVISCAVDYIQFLSSPVINQDLYAVMSVDKVEVGNNCRHTFCDSIFTEVYPSINFNSNLN